ncbi:hypothetical protein ACYULU_13265 [Breznakiellaceae bacterium SP9]
MNSEGFMFDHDDEALTRLRLIPPILRARGFRLYTGPTGKGKEPHRFVDLWQADGGAILGHTPSLVLRDLKNSGERGLFSSLPHPQAERFTKALALLFPGRVFRVYANNERLRAALFHAHYIEESRAPFPDPLFAESLLSRWRPFMHDEQPLSPLPDADILIPVLPWPLSPAVAALKSGLEAEQRFPPSDCISPALLAANTRALFVLLASKTRAKAPKHRIAESLERGGWKRQGIYCLHPGLSSADYTALFKAFLDKGFVLPPSARVPLILVPDLSTGEETQFIKLLHFIP